MAGYDLGEALYRAITKNRSPRTEPQTFGAAVTWFLKKAGGNVAAAARLADVPRRTFRDWIRGSQPRDPDRAAGIIGAAVKAERRARVSPGREAKLRALDVEYITGSATYNYDGTPRDTINIGEYIYNGGVMNDLLDLFFAGGTLAELADEFASAVDDPTGFYAETMGLPGDDPHGWTWTGLDFGL